MIFGVLSDIHDNLPHLEAALKRFSNEKTEALVFCGDFCSPFAAKMLAESGLPVHAVFGNNDGDRFHIQKMCTEYNNMIFYGEYIGDMDSQLHLGGLKIGVSHYPFYAKTMVKTGWYDCVFYGHNHQAEKQKFGNALLLNPGEIAGVFGNASIGIVDAVSRNSAIIDL
ncbi:MAG: YfcE family phosphodiesterase [Bacteroidetes bacterium]|nr:YfcE family phosphodiesterase [Bacteroidota bacterium]